MQNDEVDEMVQGSLCSVFRGAVKSAYLAPVKILSANYTISSPSVEKCPAPDMPELAFIGRSNVGKSSLINLITGNRQLAKTSASPGKTQLINHFLIKSEFNSSKPVQWYLVDLPGYGYAKVSQGKRKQWKKMIEQYIRLRSNLILLFVLIDIRHSPQALDLEFINQLGEWKIPFLLVFTKSDQITQREAAASVKSFMEKLLKNWDELPGYVVTSSVKGRGRKELLALIEEQISLSKMKA